MEVKAVSANGKLFLGFANVNPKNEYGSGIDDWD